MRIDIKEEVTPVGLALICDPDHAVRITMRKELQEIGFDILECRDGRSAVVTARANTVEIAIVDIGMRDEDRSSAAYEIRRLGIPVLLLVDSCDPPVTRVARRVGAAGILVKPFRGEDLVVGVEMAFAHTEELEVLKENVKDLQETAETSKVISKAKDLLVRTKGIYPLEAFSWIKRLAVENRTSMRKIAEAFIITEGL
ncbi:response regulator [Geomonas sp. Red32]|uniref:ANTAR domain-containing response regulator n=1 Tax=Geomonas sp. Red32 TaxID=2912856 RepID=UPI00202CB840|nr:response regulator [Geomonas sp. Red32]MCM0084246.1 response regulator [Geomonas sp. Red32]